MDRSLPAQDGRPRSISSHELNRDREGVGALRRFSGFSRLPPHPSPFQLPIQVVKILLAECLNLRRSIRALPLRIGRECYSGSLGILSSHCLHRRDFLRA